MTRQLTAAGLCAIALAVLVTGSLDLPVRGGEPHRHTSASAEPGVLPARVLRPALPPRHLALSPLATRTTVSVAASRPAGPRASTRRGTARVRPASSVGCTAWTSTDTPPPTIRVLRTLGPLAGSVQEVDFRSYVATTFAAEWPSHYEAEALKAGAIAVKQYGWYYTTVYRGRTSATGECYDVEDDTTDQYFQPEIKTPHAQHHRALDATWHLSLRKWRPKSGASRFFATGYRSGTTGRCGAEADQWHLFQRGVNGCALDGMTMEQILRVYLDPKLEIVDPGAHDILGRGYGDAAHLAYGPDAGLVPTVHRGTGSGFAGAVRASFGLDATTLLGVASADVSGDGREDLISLSRLGARAQQLSVALSDGTGYRAPSTWWEGETGRPSARARLLVEDLDGDGRPDAGVLGEGAVAGTASLLFFKGRARDFHDPLPWWTGPLELARSATWAGDANGDGRGDLIVRLDRGDAGLAFLVAPSQPAGDGLDPLVLWHDAPDLRATTTRHVPGDADRDGRTDLWLATPSGAGTSVSVLRSSSAAFTRLERWTSPASAPLVFGRVKLGAADLDADARGDVVLYYDRGARGTRLIALLSEPSGVTSATWLDDPGLDWKAAWVY